MLIPLTKMVYSILIKRKLEPGTRRVCIMVQEMIFITRFRYNLSLWRKVVKHSTR